MRARYTQLPDAQYLKDWGLPVSQYADMFSVEVWPENWTAWSLFEALQTQWRVGAGGVVGLDYGVLADELRAREIPHEDHDRLRAEVRVMEAAALQEIYAEAEK